MSLYVKIKKKLAGFDLNIEFESGEGCMMRGILGASGCGKSMTLKCIAGIGKPDEGRIVLNGRVLYDSKLGINLKPGERRAGYLFQNYALFPHMNAYENIRLAASCSAERLNELISVFEIGDIMKLCPDKLSGGQKQRVAMARMLAAEPELIMLDEPFAALDAYLKERLQLELYDIIKSYGRDALIVTHSRDEIYRLCDRLTVMESGRVSAEGSRDEIFKNPQTVAAARLTGCKNIEPAKLIDEHTLYIEAWNAYLHIEKEADTDTEFVGIRAHHLKPVYDDTVFNTVEVRGARKIEEQFERVFVFENNIWWKTGREEFEREYGGRIPSRLYIPEEAVLLLKN